MNSDLAQKYWEPGNAIVAFSVLQVLAFLYALAGKEFKSQIEDHDRSVQILVLVEGRNRHNEYCLEHPRGCRPALQERKPNDQHGGASHSLREPAWAWRRHERRLSARRGNHAIVEGLKWI